MPDEPDDRLTVILLAGGVEGGLIGVAWLLGWWLDQPPLRTFVWDARAALSGGHGWEIALWGKNLGDERYVAQATDDGLGMGYRVFNAPRTYGEPLRPTDMSA